LNGILLSRIYCKWDKNKVEYDILRDRIGDQNVIPWIEDDAEADKKYIESRETEILSEFNHFVDSFALKYKAHFEKLAAYDKTTKLQKQIEWSQQVDITQHLVDTLNAAFDELRGFDLFRIQKRANDKRWSDYFKEQSELLAKKIAGFNQIEKKVGAKILEISAKNPFDIFNKKGDNEANQKMLVSAIEALLIASDLNVMLADFLANFKAEFKQSLTVESVTDLMDNMSVILEGWYAENGYENSGNDDASSVEAWNAKDEYFAYPVES
jgi:hypothetical protein